MGRLKNRSNCSAVQRKAWARGIDSIIGQKLDLLLLKIVKLWWGGFKTISQSVGANQHP